MIPTDCSYFEQSQFYKTFAYSGTVVPLLCPYSGGSKGPLPTHEQAQLCKDLLPLVSYILRKFLFTIIYSIQSTHVCVNKMNRTGIVLRTKMKGANPRISPLTEWFYAWRNDIGAKSVLFCCIRIYSEPLSQNRCYAASLLLMWL